MIRDLTGFAIGKWRCFSLDPLTGKKPFYDDATKEQQDHAIDFL